MTTLELFGMRAEKRGAATLAVCGPLSYLWPVYTKVLQLTNELRFFKIIWNYSI